MYVCILLDGEKVLGHHESFNMKDRSIDPCGNFAPVSDVLGRQTPWADQNPFLPDRSHLHLVIISSMIFRV